MLGETVSDIRSWGLWWSVELGLWIELGFVVECGTGVCGAGGCGGVGDRGGAGGCGGVLGLWWNRGGGGDCGGAPFTAKHTTAFAEASVLVHQCLMPACRRNTGSRGSLQP
jgi:hypothetical protein